MSADLKADPRKHRHEAKKAAIVRVAWRLAREHGLSGLSLRTLAAEVGIRQPSLYVYFPSKNDLYDAMFALGNEQLLTWMDGLLLPDDPHEAAVAFSRGLMGFFTEDDMRYELLFERTLPGFTPSAASYALAQEFYRRTWDDVLAPAGLRTQEQVDIYVALMAGLAETQLSNDPGGDRWTRHVDWLIGTYLREIAPKRRGN